MSNSNINFYFKHIESGVNVTPQDWTHFFKLQGNRDYKQIWMSHLEYYTRERVITQQYWQSRNKFWEGAKGFEKEGQLNCTGIPVATYLDVIRLFLKELHNHACMQGDVETIKKTRMEDRFFHSPSANHIGVHTKLLTA